MQDSRCLPLPLWPMHKQILLLPVPIMAVLLTIYPITVQLLPMEQPRSYFIGVSVSRKLLPQQAPKKCSGRLSMRRSQKQGLGFKSVVSPLMVMQSPHNSTIRICSSVCSSQPALHLIPKSWCSLPAEAPATM